MFLQLWSFVTLVRCCTSLKKNEARIKKIIKSRSPTMRHVSRTHRVALDWLFDRINLDPKIQIKYVDTKTNSLTYWQLGISHVMSGTIFSVCSTLAISALPVALKQCRKECNQKQEKKIVAKSKPTLNLVSGYAASSPTAPSSSASSRPEVLRAPCQEGSNLMAHCAGKPAAGSSNQNDAASSFQVWLSDAKTNDSPRKVAAADMSQGLSFPESARKIAAEIFGHQRRGRLEVAAQSPRIWSWRTTLWESLLELEKTTQTRGRKQDGESSLDTMIWEGWWLPLCKPQFILAMVIWSLTFYLPQRTVNCCSMWQGSWSAIEIQWISVIDWQNKSCKRTTLLNDCAVRLSTAKALVFSDSVLCIGRISEHHIEAWKEQIDWFLNSLLYRELDRFGGEPAEFEWKKIPRIHDIPDSRRDPEHDGWNSVNFNFKFCQLSSNNVERIQAGTREERIMAKSRPTLNLASKAAASSSTTQSSSASNVPGIVKQPVKAWVWKLVRGDLQLKIRIKMTQRRVLKCGNQMQRRRQVRGDLLLQRQTRTWTFKQVWRNLRLKV